MAKKEINATQQNIVMVKLIPPYLVPHQPFASYATYEVEKAVKLFNIQHKYRPLTVYQDFTNNVIYIPLEKE